MDVVSHCSLPVAGRVWKPRPGAFVLTFACKATFTLAPGKLALAAEQQPLHEVDRPWSDTVTSLYAASDLVPRKLRSDVVLIGNAYAPGGAPVQRLLARIVVGELDKAIEVWCDRTLRRDGSVVNGPFFTQLPLLYERAAGGPGTENPVGMPAERNAYGNVSLPNLTPPGTQVGLDAPIRPTGFGPIASRWPSRLARLGRHAEALEHGSWHDAPLPPDLDMAYFNVAPRDQQPPAIRGDERIVLENLHAEHAQLTMTLPGIRPRAKVTGQGADKSVQMGCDTLWIDTSRGLCCLTYRGQVLLGSASDAGWIVVTLDGADEDESASGRRHPVGESLTGTVTIEERERPIPRAQAVTLPFLAKRDAPGAEREPRAGGGLPFQAPGEVPKRAEAVLPFSMEAPPAAPPPAVVWSSPILPPMPAPAQILPPVPAPVQILSTSAIAPPVSESPWALPSAAPGAGTIAPVTAQAAASGPAPGDFRSGGGALLASNAAAGLNKAQRAARPSEPARPLIGSAPAPRAAPPREPPDALDLVFFDAAALPRMRRVPAWKKLVAKLDDKPLASEEDDPAAAKDPVSIEDRREILEILVHAAPSDAAALDEAMARAVHEDGRFHAPLVLLVGELQTPFDEVETLKSTVTTVTPLIGNDESLRAAVEVAKEFLKLPGLSSSPAVTEGLTGRVRDAFNAGKRTVPAGYLDAQTERALLEQRFYQRRMVLGGRRQRALFQFLAGTQGAAPVVAYLPDEVAMKLPMFARFKVRMIARVHLALDQYEQGALGLETLALARLVTPPRRPG